MRAESIVPCMTQSRKPTTKSYTLETTISHDIHGCLARGFSCQTFLQMAFPGTEHGLRAHSACGLKPANGVPYATLYHKILLHATWRTGARNAPRGPFLSLPLLSVLSPGRIFPRALPLPPFQASVGRVNPVPLPSLPGRFAPPRFRRLIR